MLCSTLAGPGVLEVDHVNELDGSKEDCGFILVLWEFEGVFVSSRNALNTASGMHFFQFDI